MQIGMTDTRKKGPTDGLRRAGKQKRRRTEGQRQTLDGSVGPKHPNLIFLSFDRTQSNQYRGGRCGHYIVTFNKSIVSFTQNLGLCRAKRRTDGQTNGQT